MARRRQYRSGDARWVKRTGRGRVWWISRRKWNAYMREYMRRRRLLARLRRRR